MKHATLFFVFLLVVLFLLSSCQTGLFKKGQGVSLIAVHIGKTGLEMGYLENLPPKSVFASTPQTESLFPVAVKLENKGATDITEGYLSVALEKEYLQLKEWTHTATDTFSIGTSQENTAFTLAGKSSINPLGDEEIVSLTVKALPLDPQSQTHASTIIATACYGYETLAAAEVCINPELFSTKPLEKICQPGTTTLSQGQGAPIAVTSVETKMLPGPGESMLVQFLITVQNAAKGQPLARTSVARACSSLPLEHTDLNVVGVSDLRVSRFSFRRGDFECSPVPVQLREGTATFRCTLKPNLLRRSEGTFKTTLFIALDYGYMFSAARNVQIERVN